MTFMRSNSGIKNYALFRNSLCTIYIEGRNKCGKSASASMATFDEIFYNAILKDIFPHIKFYLKVVGSKKDVFAYADRIYQNSIDNAFVIVDKDHEGLTSNILNSDKVVRTYGYSWENDFWSKKLCFQVLKDVTIVDKSKGRNSFYKKYGRFLHRIHRISKIDLLSKIHGRKYIPSSEKSTGLNIVGTTYFGVCAKDLRRFNVPSKVEREKILDCGVVKLISASLGGVSPAKVIRGHLWEHACIHLISNSYKDVTGEKSMPNQVVKNIGFSRFSENPKNYLDKDVYTYYSKSLKKATQSSFRH